MKAIILTNADVNDEEKELLLGTTIFKLALNQHAEELKPVMRIISDYIAKDIVTRFPQKVLSVRDRWNCPNRVLPIEVDFKGATILCAVEYLKKIGYNEIELVADNTVHSKDFQELVKSNLIDIEGVFQYRKGNFKLPTKSIKDFIK